MKVSDVENIINNFRVFELYIPRDANVTLAKTMLKSLGANRIREQLYAEPFEKAPPAAAEEKK